MRVVVTGGAGFIGSEFVLQAVADPTTRVVVVDKLTYSANINSLAVAANRPNFRFVHADVCDYSAIGRLLEEEQPHAVVHLAAETHVDRSIVVSSPFIETNIAGTHSLLEATRLYWSALHGRLQKEFRFLHVSTDEVFGSLGPEGHFTETTRYDPSSPYSASKAAADHLVSAWYRTYGLPTLTANCSNNYGPRQFPEKLIPLMIVNALEGRPLPIYGDGLNVRDWIHVSDHVRALNLVLSKGRPGQSYLIGARAERRNIDIVTLICDYLDEKVPHPGRRDLIRFVEDRLGHDRHYAIDPTKIETELGWRPEQSFETALKSTIDWYLDNRAWWEPLMDAHEARATQ
ncbi:MAG: dTDP-glucose 4,6-dehydratase [Hyphomonadaceae bacterium]|nr:dTDP-glucose 4,6-dehydratase [Hyphomonadaceae bacterium]